MTETAEGTLLWEPPEGFKENATITRYMEWLAREKGLSFEDYTALWEWSVTDIDGFWAEPVGVLRRPVLQALRGGARAARDARGRVVPRRRAELRRARLPQRPHARRACPDPCVRAARPPARRRWARPRGAGSPPSPPASSRWAWGAATGSWRTCRTCPRRSWRSSRARHWAPSGRAARRTSGPGASSTGSPRSSPRSSSPCDGYRYGGKDYDRTDVVARLQAEIPTLQKTVLLPYLDEEPDTADLDERRAMGRGALRPTRARSSPSSGSPSTTRCGCSTPPGLPGCPRPSCTARAGSCWSTSRRPACT